MALNKRVNMIRKSYIMLTNRTLPGCLEGPSVAYAEISYIRTGRLSRRITYVSYTTVPGVYLITIRRRDYASRIHGGDIDLRTSAIVFPHPKVESFLSCPSARPTNKAFLDKRFVLWGVVTYCVNSFPE